MYNDKIFRLLVSVNPAFRTKSSNDFFIDGLLDSLKFIQLVVLMENEFSIKIKEEDMVENNFSSFENICRIVDKYNKTK